MTTERPRLLIQELTARPAVGLSDIARAAGVTLGYVSRCASGQQKPSARVRRAAERLLGRPADELFAPVKGQANG